MAVVEHGVGMGGGGVPRNVLDIEKDTFRFIIDCVLRPHLECLQKVWGLLRY